VTTSSFRATYHVFHDATCDLGNDMSSDPIIQAGSGGDVFVSYASQDAAVANSLVENLEQHGCKCWIAPRDVKPGAQYADAIVRAINEAKALVLVMSGSAVGSSHVGKEIERASSKRKPIIAFRIDAAPLNHALEYFLSESQWIDVKALGMPAALNKLKEAVGQGSKASSPEVTASRNIGGPKKRIAIAATAVVVVIAIAVGLGAYFWSSKHVAQVPAIAAITDKSIAVLPFTDMSEKKDQEYFGDGMAEEIIDLLVKVPGLKVIARTSSFQFKGQSQDLRAVGEKLGAHYVLEGSVRRSGDDLRVTAQLINSRDGTHLWSQSFDRKLTDVLTMQDEIAANLVRALQIEVTTAEMVSRPALRTPEGYTLFLQGLHAIDRYDQQGFEQAASDFQRALDLDPSLADAAAALAWVSEIRGEFEFMPVTVAFEQARHAADLAIKLDPNLAIAHAALGSIHDEYDWDWPAADRELKLALALAPNDARVLLVAAQQSLTQGRLDDGLMLQNASLERDPLNPGSYFMLSWIQIRRGRFAEAETAIRRTLEISPTYGYAHYYLGIVLLARGNPDAALTEFLRETVDWVRVGGSAMAYFALGRKADSDAALAQLLMRKDVTNHPYNMAQIYAFRGESDEALKWLERSYASKNTGLYHIKGDPPFNNLEGDPRYKAFLKKMNLPEG
jgi:TolB-like protein/tetratricopeptide (TPR) repeat protein